MRKKIDRFTIQEVLSEGSSGSVYKAEEELPGGVRRPVALKVLGVIPEGDKKAEEHFAREVRLAVALGGHPNIVSVYAMGLTDRLPWVAMEYASQTLAQVISEQPGSAEQVARMMEQVASGLLAMHTLEPPVLHNDLTPSNILITRFGDCKISDFGLASPVGVDRTRVMATVRYAAPELLSREFGPLSPATDLYALGHIAYEMALGGKLYRQQFPAVYEARAAGKDGTPAKWMAWHCTPNTRLTPIHELRTDFPQWLADIIANLTHKPREDRYASADAVLTALRHPHQATETPMATTIPPAPAALSVPRPTVTTPPAARAPMAATGAERYYVRLGTRVSGPFDLVSLQRQVRQGVVSRLHQVSSDRITWRSAASVEELFAAS